MRISVITASIGTRETIHSTVARVEELLRPGDEHIIVYDRAEDYPVIRPKGKYVREFWHEHPNNTWGEYPRAYGYDRAEGEIAVFLDDDDWPGRAAYKTLHDLPNDPDTFRLFRSRYDKHLYSTPTLVYGTATCMLAVPVRKDAPSWREADLTLLHNAKRVAHTGNNSGEDWLYATLCLNFFPNSVHHRECLTYVRPHEFGGYALLGGNP
jgi:glycosyltransferase involved in cell wall biosynthesis